MRVLDVLSILVQSNLLETPTDEEIPLVKAIHRTNRLGGTGNHPSCYNLHIGLSLPYHFLGTCPLPPSPPTRRISTFPHMDYVPSKHSHCGTPTDRPHSANPYPTNSDATHVSDVRPYVATAKDFLPSPTGASSAMRRTGLVLLVWGSVLVRSSLSSGPIGYLSGRGSGSC